MESKFRPYSDPTNLATIRAISHEIIRSVEPDEEVSLEELVDGLVKDYEDGLITTADIDARTSGGFGPLDLTTLVVVPVVVCVLEKLSEEIIEFGSAKFKEWLKSHQQKKHELSIHVDQLVEEKYVVISEQVKSKKSKSKEKIIKQTTKTVIKRQLRLLE